MGEPGFWDNQESAQATMNQLKQINASLKPLSELIKGADDLAVMLEFAESGEEMTAEIQAAVAALTEEFSKVELQAMLSAPEDASSAFVAIQSGEGGTDAQDFAETLLRMYQRWAETRGFS